MFNRRPGNVASVVPENLPQPYWGSTVTGAGGTALRAGADEAAAGRRRSLRILHLIAPAPFGGLESVVRALAAGQVEAGHVVHVGAVLDVDGAPNPLLRALEAAGVQVRPIVVAPRAYWYESRRIRDLCGEVAPDVVHTHGTRADVIHGGTARRLGIPTVSTSHGFTGGDLKNRLFERLQARAHRRCAAVVAVSRPMAERIQAAGVPAGRVHVVPNGWAGGAVPFLGRAEARAALGIDATDVCVGFVGRLSPEKGPDVLLEAWPRVRAAASLAVIGEGALGASLRRQDLPGDSGAVRWLGALEGAGRFMKAFDLLVLSSRTEGTPVVLLEAMAASVPVVATAVGGVPDVLSNAEGWLVAPEDPPALAAAITEALADRAGAARRAAAATRRLERDFGAEAWVRRYDEVYEQCGAVAARSEGNA